MTTSEEWFLQNYPFKNKPYLHQAAFLQRFWRKQGVALLADMGTGKSFMLINNAAMLYDRGAIDALLVLAPKGVYRNWYTQEIPKHMPEHISYKIACWNPSPKKAEKAELEEMLASTTELRILVMNIEAFSTPKGVTFANMFLRVT